MELVAASKMRKSVARVIASRYYADAAWDIVLDLILRTHRSHPLLEERPIRRVAVAVVTSNRGLCGSFNLNAVHKALKLVEKEQWSNDQVDFITFGKKGAQILSSLKKNIVADFPKDDSTDEVADILPFGEELLGGFTGRRYDEVCLVYTHFFSSLKQEARVRYLLPVVKPSRYLGHIAQNGGRQNATDVSEFLFEPTRERVLAAFLPRIVQTQIYQAVLESEASEHSARMMAMRNATDAAVDMIDSLTLAYNQARQAAITAELAEISAASIVMQ